MFRLRLQRHDSNDEGWDHGSIDYELGHSAQGTWQQRMQ